MKTKILLSITLLCAIVSSCVYIDMSELASLIDSGIDEYDEAYASWIVVKSGDEQEKYETLLNYPEEHHIVAADLFASDIVFEGVSVAEEKIDSMTVNGVTTYCQEVLYNFNFSEFVVPVKYTKECAFWQDINGTQKYPMPSVQIADVKTNTSMVYLQSELIDGRVYHAYLLSLEITDNKYVTSTTEVKVLVRTFIAIDDSYNEKEHYIVI